MLVIGAKANRIVTLPKKLQITENKMTSKSYLSSNTRMIFLYRDNPIVLIHLIQYS